MDQTKARSSNIELFRIVTMLLIVMHHYVVNSGVLDKVYENPTAVPSLFLLFLGAFGKAGINCFVLITGYFMCKSKITLKKFLKLLLEVLFYNVVIFLLFILFGKTTFSLTEFVNILLPFRTLAQNFTGTYLIFFLFIPFLNRFLEGLNRLWHARLLLFITLTYVAFSTIPTFSVSSNYVIWYMALYFFASYIRLYPCPLFEKTKFWGILSLGLIALTCGVTATLAFISKATNSRLSYAAVSKPEALIPLALAISSFLFFKNLKMPQCKFINTVSSTTFGILLIHANGGAMREWLWKDVLNNVGAYDSPYLYLHAILAPIGIFIVACLIDLIRIHLLEKPFFMLWDRWSEKLLAPVRRCTEKIERK